MNEKNITIGGKNISDLINSPDFQRNLDKKFSKLIKVLIWEFFEIGMDFKEKTKIIRKERKVGRPKQRGKVGRPKQGID